MLRNKKFSITIVWKKKLERLRECERKSESERTEKKKREREKKQGKEDGTCMRYEKQI